MKDSNRFVSVLIPCRNEQKYICNVLDSILAQSYDQRNIEIVVIDGDSDDKTSEKVIEYCDKYSNVRLLKNFKRTVPYALNLGIQNANGDVIIRMDAHASYPEDYISTLITKLFELDADNVGGIIETLPIGHSLKSIAIAEALSSPFGVGNSYFRIGSNEIMQVDTVPFGCYKRTVFDKIGNYDEELTRNQDDEFNARLIKNGGKIFLIPSVVIKYFARDKYSKVYSMFFQYGFFKPLVNKKIGKPTSLRQFAPLVFVMMWFFLPVFYIINKPLIILIIPFLFLYFLLSMIVSIRIAIKKKQILLVFPLFWIFLVIHFGYGFGYILGLINLFHKGSDLSTDVKMNR